MSTTVATANDTWNHWGLYGAGDTGTVADGVIRFVDPDTTVNGARIQKFTLKGGDKIDFIVTARAESGNGRIYFNLDTMPGTLGGEILVTGSKEFRKYSLSYVVPLNRSLQIVYLGIGTTYPDIGTIEAFSPNVYINGTLFSPVQSVPYGVQFSAGGGVLKMFDLDIMQVKRNSATDYSVTLSSPTLAGDPFSFLGTFNPRYRVQGDSNETAAWGQAAYNISGLVGPTLRHLKSRGTKPGEFSATQAGDTLGAWDMFGDNGTGYARAARIDISQFANPASGLVPGQINFKVTTQTVQDQVALSIMPGTIRPGVDNAYNFGATSFRLNNSYFSVAPTVTSDENSKTEIMPIDDLCLNAWSKVEFMKYRLKDSVEAKGESARWHFGLIAQRVKQAFEDAGLDAFKYGLLCYDEWQATDEVLHEWANEYDSEGNLLREGGSEIAQPAVSAGSRYGIRYEEALALEAALMRRVSLNLQERLAALEAKS